MRSTTIDLKLFACDICTFETDNEVAILNHRKNGCFSLEQEREFRSCVGNND